MALMRINRNASGSGTTVIDPFTIVGAMEPPPWAMKSESWPICVADNIKGNVPLVNPVVSMNNSAITPLAATFCPDTLNTTLDWSN